MICVDTNAVIAAITQRKPLVRRRLEQALADRVVIGIPSLVFFETWYGIRKSTRTTS
jgi:predicted nucleic acid-binding protein